MHLPVKEDTVPSPKNAGTAWLSQPVFAFLFTKSAYTRREKDLTRKAFSKLNFIGRGSYGSDPSSYFPLKQPGKLEIQRTPTAPSDLFFFKTVPAASAMMDNLHMVPYTQIPPNIILYIINQMYPITIPIISQVANPFFAKKETRKIWSLFERVLLS